MAAEADYDVDLYVEIARSGVASAKAKKRPAALQAEPADEPQPVVSSGKL